MKRIVALVLALLMLVAVLPAAFAVNEETEAETEPAASEATEAPAETEISEAPTAEPTDETATEPEPTEEPTEPEEPELPTGMAAFAVDLTSLDNPFSDVKRTDWFFRPVCIQSKLGVMIGVGEGLFNPYGTVTIAELLQVSVKIHEAYFGKEACREQQVKYYGYEDIVYSADWRYAAMQKARGYRICGTTEFDDQDALKRVATREEMARLLFNSLPASEFQPINKISCIPDSISSRTFIERTNPNYTAIRAFYESGILTGINTEHEYNSKKSLTRAELATILGTITQPSTRSRFSIDSVKMIYGYSGAYIATGGISGYELEAYRIGDGPRTLLCTFCLHGLEGYVATDSLVIERLGKSVLANFEKDQSSIEGKWSVYILPDCNPDGTHNKNAAYATGVGRRTDYRFTDSSRTAVTNSFIGGSISGGIDINRSFTYGGGFYPQTTTTGTNSQYYTGSFAFGAPESLALSGFAAAVKSTTGANVCVDMHGWFTQVLATNSWNNKAGATFMNALGYSSGRMTESAYAKGYFSTYCYRDLGFKDAVLVELPLMATTDSSGKALTTVAAIQSKFDSMKLTDKVLSAFSTILKSY